MTLELVPAGRGKWSPMLMRLDQPRGGLLIQRGQRITLGGIVWRIRKVLA